MHTIFKYCTFEHTLIAVVWKKWKVKSEELANDLKANKLMINNNFKL